jgi:hypothetical protein
MPSANAKGAVFGNKVQTGYLLKKGMIIMSTDDKKRFLLGFSAGSIVMIFVAIFIMLVIDNSDLSLMDITTGFFAFIAVSILFQIICGHLWHRMLPPKFPINYILAFVMLAFAILSMAISRDKNGPDVWGLMVFPLYGMGNLVLADSLYFLRMIKNKD